MPVTMTAAQWMNAPHPGQLVLLVDAAVNVLLSIESAVIAGATKADIIARVQWLDRSDPGTRNAIRVALFSATVCCPRDSTEQDISRAMGAVLGAVASVHQNGDPFWSVVLVCEMARPLAVSLREHGSLTALRDLAGALEALAGQLQDDTPARYIAEHRAAWVRSIAAWMDWEWAQTVDADRGPKLLKAAIAPIQTSLTALDAACASLKVPVPPTDRLELQYRLVQAEQELLSLESPAPVVASSAWLSLIEGYLEAGNRANAGAAAGMWLQSALRTAPGLKLLPNDTIDAIERWIREGLDEDGSDVGNRMKLAQILARLVYEKGDLDAAEQLARQGVEAGAQTLLHCADVVLRSNLRSILEDWVGLALLIDLSRGDHGPGALYEHAHEVLRGFKPILAPSSEGSGITVLVHRWATAAGRTNDEGRVIWTRGAFAEEAWEPLTGLLRASKRDLRATQTNAPAEEYSRPDEWYLLIRQQAERLGFRKEGAPGQAITIHCDRSDIPLQAMVNAGVLESAEYGARRAVGVVGRRTNLAAPLLPTPLPADPVIFVSTFEANDPMRDHLRRMYVTLRHDEWAWEEPSSLPEFRDVLRRRAKGFVVGMHGFVKDMLAPGVVKIGTDQVESRELLELVNMECAPFVVLVSCFAASGFRDAMGGGTSLVDQFLGRGASVVLAAPFPVFMDGGYAVSGELNVLLRRIDRLPLPLEPGAVAKEAADMVERVRAQALPPRYWTGFTIWATAATRPL